MTTKRDSLLEKALSLPQEPGCYLMQDKLGRVIYVGKAKRLKSRVTSYFNESAKSLKTEHMVAKVEDFQFIITRSDAESFILENNLIKEHAPKYNIRLRDDKSYPYLQINYEEDFPRLEYVRRPKKAPKKELYGPFPTGSNISQILRILTKSFALRDCSLSEFKSRKTPCLYHQMKQCSAPCVNLIAQSDYEKDLKTAIGLFQGKIKANKMFDALTEKMNQYAENEEFEMAALLRDDLKVLGDFREQSFDQQVENLISEKDADFWSYFVGEEEIDLSLYLIRSGMLLGQKNFHFIRSELMDELHEELFQKILQYYSFEDDVVPERIVVDLETEIIGSFREALESLGHTKVTGYSKKVQALLEMCRKHAEESQRVRKENQDSVYVGLNKLKELLQMKERPQTLECYDIAIWQGKSPTASQIVFEEGKPHKQKYRYYHLNERPEGNNDFAMMREVFERRLQHGSFPDVFIVDGGLAQVNTVKAILDELKIETPIVGIAKSRELTRGDFRERELSKSDERLIIPGRANPYSLTKCPSLFKIIVSMRDEAHRFSRKLHHKAESKRVFQTWLDQIKGLGEESKKRILRENTFTQDELRAFDVNELKNLFDLKIDQARALKNYLNSERE